MAFQISLFCLVSLLLDQTVRTLLIVRHYVYNVNSGLKSSNVDLLRKCVRSNLKNLLSKDVEESNSLDLVLSSYSYYINSWVRNHAETSDLVVISAKYVVQRKVVYTTVPSPRSIRTF